MKEQNSSIYSKTDDYTPSYPQIYRKSVRTELRILAILLSIIFSFSIMSICSGCSPASTDTLHYRQKTDDMQYDLFLHHDYYIMLWSRDDTVEYIEKGLSSGKTAEATGAISAEDLETFPDNKDLESAVDVLTYDNPLFQDDWKNYKRPDQIIPYYDEVKSNSGSYYVSCNRNGVCFTADQYKDIDKVPVPDWYKKSIKPVWYQWTAKNKQEIEWHKSDESVIPVYRFTLELGGNYDGMFPETLDEIKFEED